MPLVPLTYYLMEAQLAAERELRHSTATQMASALEHSQDEVVLAAEQEVALRKQLEDAERMIQGDIEERKVQLDSIQSLMEEPDAPETEIILA